MAYDAMGNITLKSDRSASTYTYHATKKHQVTAVGTLAYHYDNNGNMDSREAPANTITWSSANLPLVITHSGTTNTFSYGPNRDRWRLVYVNGSTTETTIYIGGLLEKWTRGTLTEWRHTIYAGDQPVALYTRQSGSASANLTRYFHLDHLGSIETVTDSTNAVYVRERFTSYGQRGDPATWGLPIPSGDATLIGNLSRRGYTFHESLGGATLNHMNGRVQDPLLGRFLSADPYIQDPGLTQAFNRYSYVYNNSLSYIDPSGFGILGDAAATYVCGPGDGNPICSMLVSRIVDQYAPDAIKKLVKAVGDLIDSVFDGLFGGGGGPPSLPKGCNVSNPVACSGVPGAATRTPGFNPMIGLAAQAAGVDATAMSVEAARRGAEGYVRRQVGKILSGNPAGWSSSLGVLLQIKDVLRGATSKYDVEVSIAIVRDSSTGRYYVDPRSIVGGNNICYRGTVECDVSPILGARGAFTTSNVNATVVGLIHTHPDDVHGWHGRDRGLYSRVYAIDTDAALGAGFEGYIITRSGAVCRYVMVQQGRQVYGRTPEHVAGPSGSPSKGCNDPSGGFR